MRKSIRFLCLLLCLLLTCSAACAADYTLPEKMDRQIESGSGVKGAVSLAVAGGADWLDLLLPFTGANLQIRYIVVDGQFQGQLYALDDQEQQRALTQVYGDETHLYLRSELIPDTVLSLPFGTDLMDTLFGNDQSNPTFFSVVEALLDIPEDEWQAHWAPVLEPYETALDQWLAGFAADPSISPAEGGSSVTLRYTIPADALKAVMKDLVRQFLQDGALLDLLDPLLTDAQKAVYLNPTLGYYYDAVIDALPIEGELTMVRVISTRGVVTSSTLVMPLPENANGWTTLTCGTVGDETTLTLEGPEQSITLVTQETVTMSDRTIWNGFFRYLPAQGMPVSAAYSLTKQFSTYTDAEDGRAHEETSWTLTARRDLSHLAEDDPSREDYADFEDISLTLSTHYSGRAQYNNPTTLEAVLSARLPALTVDLSMTLRTTSPWVLSDLSTDGAESLLELSPERIAELLAEFTRNAALTMTTLTTTPATVTDLEAPAEPTVVPPAQ